MALYQDLSQFGIANRSYSVAEWQELERRTGEKFEYHNGRLVHWRAMAGGTFAHSAISGNIIYALGAAVRERERDDASAVRCGVHTSDLKLKLPDSARYVYPDAAVVCGSPEFDAAVPTAVRNPTVVTEVLSPSSEQYDGGKKFSYYAKLDSLREYLLVTQDAHQVEVRSRREAGGLWDIRFYLLGDTGVKIPSLEVELSMDEIYRGVETPFDEEPGDEGATVPA